MTETTTKSPRILLFEAAAIARFDHAKGWPGDFLPGQLAALMAGGWKDEYKKDYRLWGNIIAAAIKAGELETTEKNKTTEQAPRKIGFVKSWKHSHYGYDPDMLFQPDPITTHWQVIARTAFAAWLDAIDENPSEHVRAWLGPEWKKSPPEPNATTDKPEGTINEIPGTLPPRAAGKLAIKAAWQIECKTKRRASAKEVLALLQKWADAGEEPAVLVKSLPEKRAVQWLTTKGKHLEYTLEACEKTLEKWAESRKLSSQ